MFALAIALNARDSAAMRAEFHFPHYRFSAGGVQVYQHAEEYGIDIFDNRSDTNGWHHTDWDYRRVDQGNETKLHLDVQFTRYRGNGSVLGTYQSLWIVINFDGRWGVQARSSYAA